MHLAGEERPHRDRRDEQLDDAGLLLFDDALRDRRRRRATRRAGTRRRSRCADDVRAGAGVAVGSGFRRSTGGSWRQLQHELRRCRGVGDDGETRAATTGSPTIAASTSPSATSASAAARSAASVTSHALRVRDVLLGVRGHRDRRARRVLRLEPAPDRRVPGRSEEQDRGRDDERLAAQLRADLALGDEPDRLHGCRGRGTCRSACVVRGMSAVLTG